MKRLVIASIIAVGLLGSNLLGTASAGDSARLQRQIDTLKRKVAALQVEVYQCEQLANLRVTEMTGYIWDNDVVVYTC